MQLDISLCHTIWSISFMHAHRPMLHLISLWQTICVAYSCVQQHPNAINHILMAHTMFCPLLCMLVVHCYLSYPYVKQYDMLTGEHIHSSMLLIISLCQTIGSSYSCVHLQPNAIHIPTSNNITILLMYVAPLTATSNIHMSNNMITLLLRASAVQWYS